VTEGALSDIDKFNACGRVPTVINTSMGNNMLSLLGTLFIGLIVGLIARAIKPGDDKLGWIMTALLGVAGSFLASYLGVAMGWYQEGASAGWIASIVGAVVLLFLYGLVKGNRRGA
jgi:uncharacterized membrane protein YeaQ/YmgE (transglycosylase-associated protein family)